MFTGIVERTGRVAQIQEQPGGARRLVVDPSSSSLLSPRELPGSDDTKIGESMACSGVCLTVVHIDESRRLSFDVIPETLGLTTLGTLVEGSRINLERALAVGDRFGGHFVTGHVDGTGTVRERRTEGDQVIFEIESTDRLISEMLPKGSITVDGISLTLVLVDRASRRFSFAAIPHTLQVTTLGDCRTGDRVNLETDAYGKWVLHGLKELASSFGNLGRRTGERSL